MKAILRSVGSTDVEVCEVNGHNFQFGGGDGDGYCYSHQSFDCLDNLSEEERNAIKDGEYVE